MVDLSKEREHVKSLEQPKRYLLNFSTTAAAVDSVLFRPIIYSFLKDFQHPELLACIGWQVTTIHTHHEMYCRLLHHHVNYENEKVFFFDLVKTFPSLSLKSNWLRDNSSSAAERVVCFASVSGIIGWSRFATVLGVEGSNRMSGLRESYDKIIRDTLLQMEISKCLYLSLEDRLDDLRAKDIIQSAIDNEKKFARDALSDFYQAVGYTELDSYIQWCGDRVLRDLGYNCDPVMPSSFQWMLDILPKRVPQAL